MKTRGHIKLHRSFLKAAVGNALSDQEFRLYLVYICEVGWDEKYKDRYGITDITQRQLVKEYLPIWSLAKLNPVRKSLIKKGLLVEISKRKTGVYNFWIFKTNDRRAELAFQLLEQKKQFTEQDVQYAEQRELEANRDRYQEMKRDRGFLGKQFGFPNNRSP